MPKPKPNSTVQEGPGGLLVGASYPIRALWLLIKNPYLRNYALIPLAVNLVVGVTVYAGLLFAGLRTIDTVIADLSHWIATAHLPDLSQLPTVSLPNLPSVDVAKLDLPKVNLPQMQLPQVSLPAWLNLPAWFHWPSIQIPTLQLPQIQLPQITWPAINWPDWQLPKFDWLKALPNGLVAILLGLLRILLSLILLLATGFVFLQFGVLLGAPWYGKLSEEIERLRTGQLQTIEVGLAGDISRAILYELKKLSLTLGLGIPLLMLNLLPGIGTILATVGGVSLASTIVCLDFLDAAQERRRLRFRQKLGMIRRSLPASASFALVCFGLVSIPFLNLLAIPICVTAGTLFFCDQIQPHLPKS